MPAEARVAAGAGVGVRGGEGGAAGAAVADGCGWRAGAGCTGAADRNGRSAWRDSQFLDGGAVEALGLGLVAEEDFEGFGFEDGVELIAGGIGEEAGFEAGGSEHGLAGEGNALDGHALLGADGAIESDEVVAQAGEFLGWFDGGCGLVGHRSSFPKTHV